MDSAVTTRHSVTLALVFAVGGCGSVAPLPRATRVEREERVTPADPAAARFFARLHGAQRAFAAMELTRLRAVAELARSLGLRSDAPPEAIATALARRVAGDAGVGAAAVGFRARLNPERHADALEAWAAALGDEAAEARAFEALTARARVRVRSERCAELSASLREVTRLTRVALAHGLTAPALAAEAEALTPTAERGAREGPAALRAEYAAAARWLVSVPVRAELQGQAAEQTVLWLRGVLNGESEDEAAVQETGCALP
jgi:hypothetical protein